MEIEIIQDLRALHVTSLAIRAVTYTFDNIITKYRHWALHKHIMHMCIDSFVREDARWPLSNCITTMDARM